MSRIIIALLATFVAAVLASAQTTWYVDDNGPHDPEPNDPTVSDPNEDGSPEHPFDAIQEGISAAVNGDTVLVLDGTYTGDGNRDLDFAGRLITVCSENGPDNCTIDCQGAASDPHRGFRLYTGETAAAIVSGVTVTNGYAPDEDVWGYPMSAGGAVFIRGSSPSLVGCRLVGNQAEAVGGGVFCYQSSAQMSTCVVESNSTVYGEGGGIFCEDSSLTISDCDVNANTGSSYGGGVAAYAYSGPLVVTNCAISNNNAEYEGGGVYGGGELSAHDCTISDNILTDGVGGGVYWDWGNATFHDCVVAGNVTQWRGGGLLCYGLDAVEIIRCSIRENVAVAGDAGDGGGASIGSTDYVTIVNTEFVGNSCDNEGGGLSCYYLPILTLINCVFTGNSANGDYAVGGGMYCEDSSPVVANCTLSGNVTNRLGGGIYSWYSAVTCANSVLWGNTGGGLRGQPAQIIIDDGAPPSISHSCVEGWNGSFGGVGNIGSDPQFVDADGADNTPGTEDDDLRLYGRSPCIDAGDNQAAPADTFDLDGDGDTAEPVPFDLAGDPRFLDDPCTMDTGQSDPGYPTLPIVDMGAYEYPELTPADADGDGVGNCVDNCPLHANPGQGDCDADGLGDVCALELGVSADCNGNGVPDECDIASGTSADDDGNGIPDECQAVIFVDASAPAGGDGASWATAFNDLHDALDIAIYPDMVWVAAGVYKPSATADPAESFRMVHGVGVYGGFAGVESTFSQRDPSANETILSGDLNGDDGPDFTNYEDNSNVLVRTELSGRDTVLDGLTIASALRNGMYNYLGGPTVNNCRFIQNGFPYHDQGSVNRFGGGIYNYVCFGDPVVSNCMFLGNAVSGYGVGGGAIFNGFDSGNGSTIVNCLFVGNVAVGQYASGGGLSDAAGVTFSRSTVVNCTFVNNSATATSSPSKGGGIDGAPDTRVDNCVLWGNTAALGPQVYYASGDGSVAYSCIQGGWPGVGNIDADPLFVDHDGPDNDPDTWEDNDYRLASGSPCIDAADDTAVPPDATDLDGDDDQSERAPLDLDYLPRFVNDPSTGDTGIADPPDYPNVVDMGAYELGIGSDLDGDCDVDIADLAQLLSNYGTTNGADYGDGDVDHDGDVQLPDLAELLAHYGDACP